MSGQKTDTSGTSGSGVDVGYVDETESWKLESRFFPSKVGGRPAWLNLSELPSCKDMECSKCHDACLFLCQVYAPIESRDDCFHRTLFVFMCLNAQCCSANDNSSFLVYRSQLKRDNPFYPWEPPEDSKDWHPGGKAEKWTDLCAGCGNRGTSHCGRCKRVKYCGRKHQLSHWRDYHKTTCNIDDVVDLVGNSSCLLPEYELIVEPEEEGKSDLDAQPVGADSDEDDDEDDDAETERLEEFENIIREKKLGTFSGDASVDVDLQNMAMSEEDKVFQTFKTRIAQNPGQVLRYQRAGLPLWPSDVHLPSDTDVPPCSYCGSKRVFEFQVLPQLLNHLSLDQVEQSIDWGVLAVYTCERSCEDGPSYKREFLWKQDIIKSFPVVEMYIKLAMVVLVLTMVVVQGMPQNRPAEQVESSANGASAGKGVCWNNGACEDSCKRAGFASGHCFFFSCYCTKDTP